MSRSIIKSRHNAVGLSQYHLLAATKAISKGSFSCNFFLRNLIIGVSRLFTKAILDTQDKMSHVICVVIKKNEGKTRNKRKVGTNGIKEN